MDKWYALLETTPEGFQHGTLLTPQDGRYIGFDIEGCRERLDVVRATDYEAEAAYALRMQAAYECAHRQIMNNDTVAEARVRELQAALRSLKDKLSHRADGALIAEIDAALGTRPTHYDVYENGVFKYQLAADAVFRNPPDTQFERDTAGMRCTVCCVVGGHAPTCSQLRHALHRKARIPVCARCGQDPYDGHDMCTGPLAGRAAP